MTTALDIITRSLSTIGAIAPGETLDATLASDALNMLNMLLDSSSNDNFTVTSINEISASIIGATDWTIGPTGSIVSTQRPLSINSAFVRVSNIDYPVQILNVEQYEQITLKQLNGPWPSALWYNSGTPNGTIRFWPKPSAGEIHLFCDLQFTRFATLADTVVLPQGYEMWLVWGLAELLMPGYGITDQTIAMMVAKNAAKFLGALKTTNMSPMQTVNFDSAMSGTRSRNNSGWFLTGGF